LAGVAALFTIIGGCRKSEPIRVYQAPKAPTWTLLGAIAPQADQTWFFKVVGATSRVRPHKEDFLKFLDSIRFADGAVKWTLPAGWHEEAKSGDRYATLCIGTQEPHLELAVTSLGGDGGGLLANVNRWRDQIGLDRIAESDLARKTSTRTVEGAAVTVVELDGPRKPAPPAGAAAARGPRQDPSRAAASMETLRSMFTFDLPAGWVQSRQPEGDRIFELRAGSGNQSPTVTLNIIFGPAGGLGPNVNRWRGQVGLPPVDEEQAQELARPVSFLREGGGSLVELLGSERGILCAFTLRPEFSIFLKMDGPAADVRSQRDAFETFTKSVRLNH